MSRIHTSSADPYVDDPPAAVVVAYNNPVFRPSAEEEALRRIHDLHRRAIRSWRLFFLFLLLVLGATALLLIWPAATGWEFIPGGAVVGFFFALLWTTYVAVVNTMLLQHEQRKQDQGQARPDA